MSNQQQLRVGRRDALKIGGLGVGLAAFAAACGDTNGVDDPGRVGYAPAVTDPPDYPVDDVVRLRTVSSVELTAVYAYEQLLEAGTLDSELTAMIERFVETHQRIADEMGELTTAAGGEAWECTNPWMMDRLVDPVLEAIAGSDDPARDAFNTIVSIENLTAATNQEFTIDLLEADASAATLAAATVEARQAAALVSVARGPEGYLSPALGGGDVPAEDGIPDQFAIANRFGSTGQIDLVVGAPNENGVRQTFALLTPSLNSFIYAELEPTC